MGGKGGIEVSKDAISARAIPGLAAAAAAAIQCDIHHEP